MCNRKLKESASRPRVPVIELALTEPVNSVDDAFEDGQESIHDPVLLQWSVTCPTQARQPIPGAYS